jgi:hypothetical protein
MPLPVFFARVQKLKKQKGLERNLSVRRVKRARKKQEVKELEDAKEVKDRRQENREGGRRVARAEARPKITMHDSRGLVTLSIHISEVSRACGKLGRSCFSQRTQRMHGGPPPRAACTMKEQGRSVLRP